MCALYIIEGLKMLKTKPYRFKIGVEERVITRVSNVTFSITTLKSHSFGRLKEC